MSRFNHFLAAGTLCLICAGGAAAAATASQPLELPAGRTADPAPPETGALMTADDLASVNAGANTYTTTLTNQNLNAIASGNQVNASTILSGGINFGLGAFQGFTGIGNFVINTGNNNILQGAISLTVVPAP
jgi:hypothetical protein